MWKSAKVEPIEDIFWEVLEAVEPENPKPA
jgi:hypothetical protein